MQIVRNERFNGVECDFYEGNDEIWMTRDQIGTALEYANPTKAIDNLHAKYKDRLDQFSTTLRTRVTEGTRYKGTSREVERNLVFYNARGVYELCRWSRQEKAHLFMDFVWDIVEAYRKGQLTQTAAPAADDPALNVQRAMILTQLATNFRDILSPPSLELLVGRAAELADPVTRLPRPRIEKTYTASELAVELGITKNKLGRLSNQYGLKTEENGIFILDKAAYSDKQVQNFRYNENGRTRIKELL